MTTSTLLIESVQPGDAGHYYCIATSPRICTTMLLAMLSKCTYQVSKCKEDQFEIFLSIGLHQ